MAENITIPAIPGDEQTEYTTLRQEGITLLQQRSGDIWTDYNEHDPGVTILEELCYVITELYERTRIPMADLLTMANGHMPAKDNALYSAAEILHNNPLTPGDYRKIIIDRVPQVSNAWVSPYYINNQGTGIAGMYQVLVDLQPGITGENIRLDIEKEIKTLLNMNRNAGEIFSEITFLEQALLTVSCGIYMTEYVDAEATLANILFELENDLKPLVQFSSYQELAAQGLTTDAIFEGPALLHGFIPDEELTNQVTVVYINTLIKQITQVQGVNSVKNLYVMGPDQEKKTDAYNVPAGYSVTLDLEECLSAMTLYKQNVLYPFNKNLVLSNYNQLRSNKKKPGKIRLSPDRLNIQVPHGQYVDPATYYSIQNEFPLVYGIGSERIPEKSSGSRKAKALQLKSYLLFFEQLLADFMSQVNGVNQLFSVQEQKQTFFYQPLYSVPDAPPLLKGFPGDGSGVYDTVQGQSYMNQYQSFLKSQNDYITGLEGLYKKKDDFNKRRTAFLDHLLSRFNFQFFTLSSAMPGISELAVDGIETKEELLRHMCNITASRGGLDPHITYDGGKNKLYSSGLEQLLRILSGIKYRHRNEIEVNDHNIISPKAADDDLLVIQLSDSQKAHLNTKHIHFHEALLAGLFPQNYRVESHHGEQLIYLEVNDKDHKVYTIPEGTHHKPADDIIRELAGDFLKMYIQYENLYVIDHILLKPQNSEEVYTWANPPADQVMLKPSSNYAAVDKAITSALAQTQSSATQNPVVLVETKDAYIRQDFYSGRISVVLPESAAAIKGTSYQDYFESIVATYFPAHLGIEIFWLESSDYSAFVTLFENYIMRVSGALTGMAEYLLQKPPYENMKIKK